MNSQENTSQGYFMILEDLRPWNWDFWISSLLCLFSATGSKLAGKSEKFYTSDTLLKAATPRTIMNLEPNERSQKTRIYNIGPQTSCVTMNSKQLKHRIKIQIMRNKSLKAFWEEKEKS